MKNIMSIVFLFMFNVSCGQLANEHNNSARVQKKENSIITVKFHTSGMFIFNYVNEHQIVSTFSMKNPTSADTSVSFALPSNKPVHIYAANANFTQGNSAPVLEYKTLLILPGDSVVIDQDKQQVVFSNYGISFIDSLINSKDLYNKNLPFVTKTLKEHGVKYLVDHIEMQYQTIKKSIDPFASSNIKYYEALSKLMLIWKMYKVGSIPLDAKQLSISDKAVIDSMYKVIGNNLEYISSVSSPFCNSILYYLISYNAFKEGNLTTNFWDYFDAANTSILESYFYKSFILNRLEMEYNSNRRIDNLTRVIEKIKKVGIVDHRYDSLLQAKSLLDKQFLKAVYTMQKADGETSEYTSFLRALRGSYVLVDFWASWCGPCRQQMPHLRKLKPELSKKNIKFVSISIDNDDQLDDWKAASKDEGLDKEPLNFRLQKGNQNMLLKTLEIITVPRYFLYDPSGKLISGNFITPDMKNFKPALLAEISKK